MRVTKLDKVRQIVAVLYNLPLLPDPETSSAPVKRDIKRLMRQTNEQLQCQWQIANRVLLSRAAGGGS